MSRFGAESLMPPAWRVQEVPLVRTKLQQIFRLKDRPWLILILVHNKYAASERTEEFV